MRRTSHHTQLHTLVSGCVIMDMFSERARLLHHMSKGVIAREIEGVTIIERQIQKRLSLSSIKRILIMGMLCQRLPLVLTLTLTLTLTVTVTLTLTLTLTL